MRALPGPRVTDGVVASTARGDLLLRSATTADDLRRVEPHIDREKPDHNEPLHLSHDTARPSQGRAADGESELFEHASGATSRTFGR